MVQLYGSHLLGANDRAAVVLADVRDPESVLESEPAAVLMTAVLHFAASGGLTPLPDGSSERCGASRWVLRRLLDEPGLPFTFGMGRRASCCGRVVLCLRGVCDGQTQFAVSPDVCRASEGEAGA